MGSHILRPAIDYTQSHVSPSYAQPRNIPSTSITLTCPARTHTRYQYHLHMPSHKLYLVPFFTLISPAEERTQFKIVCSRYHAHLHKVMVHLRFIHDVDIHPHHLHVHSTRPFTTTGCSPCFPPLRVTRLLLPPTEGSLDEGRGSQACTSLPSRTVFCLSQYLVYLTCDYPFPNINKAQVKPLKITILTINTGSSDQVGSSYVRFLPLEKELRSPNSVIKQTSYH